MPIISFCLVCFLILIALWLLQQSRLRRITVFEYQQAALFTRGRFQRVLAPGIYWTSQSRTVQVVDVRLQTLQLAGQEVLTTDGLSLKITLAGEYRITDAARFVSESSAPAALLYADSQQALREVVAGLAFEDLLTTREAINTRLLEHLAPRATRLGLEVSRMEVRDLILPSELRRAYAQALTARKEGQAALERARAEAASLRSLANAARLLQDHPGLLQLRALQSLEAGKGNTLNLQITSDVGGAPGKSLPSVTASA